MEEDYNEGLEPDVINESALKCNVQFLVDKYIPKNITDIFDEETEYYQKLTNKKQTTDMWSDAIPSKCFFHKDIFRKLEKISNFIIIF
jgi:hypothetical protein